MSAALDLSRWQEKPRGVSYRRWVIVSSGIGQLLKLKLFLGLVFAAWMGGLLVAALAYVFAQSVASGGWLETLATSIGPRMQAVTSVLGALIVMYPDVVVGGLYTLIFWLHSFAGLTLSLVALTVLVPRLVARDRASNALTIYLSRPLTSTDYLLGKLGTIVGVLLIMWTGPLIFGWVLSLALAPSSDFIVYSFEPFTRALLFNAIGLAVLATVALGVSALNRSSRPTIILWIALWVIAGAIAKIPKRPDWIARTSFTYNLGQVRQTVFKLDSALADASANLPLLNKELTESLARSSEKARPTDYNGALMALGAMTLLSSGIFLRRMKPE